MKTAGNRQEWSSAVRKLSGFVIGSQKVLVVGNCQGLSLGVKDCHGLF